MKTWLIRISALLGLVAVLVLTFSDVSESFHSSVDIRAALLVFLAPIFLLALFEREEISIFSLVTQMKRFRKQPNQKLQENLVSITDTLGSGNEIATLSSLADTHSDPFVRYGAELVSAKFDPKEVAVLLEQRAEAEAAQWHAGFNLAGFLAKMAPYFGMLATVIGMIKTLENMSDFSKVSGAIALAMQGTLYGLLSFTILYSPLQKMVMGYREMCIRRNRMISEWILSVITKTDPVVVKANLRSQNTGRPQ